MAISKKKLEGKYIEHVVKEIAKIVDGEYGGNQTKAAKGLGMSQPHLSNLLSGGTGRGPGLQTLILLRSKTGRSIDSLLGLPSVPEEEIVERLRMTVDTEIARIRRAARSEFAQARDAEAVRELAEQSAPRQLPAKRAK